MKYDKHNENDEYYTPSYIFDALGVEFDMDVASPFNRTHCSVPAKNFICQNSLESDWIGFLWCNPPYSGRNGKIKWVKKMIRHCNGIMLMTDRTCAEWWQLAASNCSVFMFTSTRIKYVKPNGEIADQPGTGNTLFAFGDKARKALINAEKNGLGSIYSMVTETELTVKQ